MLPYAERVSRPEELPDDDAMQRLINAACHRNTTAKAADAARAELKAAVVAAAAAGGSNRVIARLGQISTKTARDWVDESRGA